LSPKAPAAPVEKKATTTLAELNNSNKSPIELYEEEESREALL